jgi:hypothetical protein
MNMKRNENNESLIAPTQSLRYQNLYPLNKMDGPERNLLPMTRIVLSPLQAVEIYTRKLELLASQKSGPYADRSRWLLRGQSIRVSERYNVSAKTIRDIWSRRTWKLATDSLWRAESLESSSQVP